MDDIEERLRSHAQAFDGLLSLIPAKFYYADEEGATDQWQRKKQTKEQAREAKRAKLDPDSAKTAKDVMDENARKRKRAEGEPESGSSDGELGDEAPREGLNRGDAKPKKMKQEGQEDKTKKSEEAEKRRKEKEEKKQQKKAAQKEKKKAKDTARKEKQQEKPAANSKQQESKPSTKVNGPEPAKEDSSDDENDVEDDGAVAKGLSLDLNPEQPSSASSAPNSPNFDASNPHSGSSSISSIVPPTDSSKKPSSEPKPLKHTPEQLKERLQKRLDELRAARHADGFDGKPARNRQELIEARRQKAEQRKNHKKLLRQKAREEEQQAKDDAMARRFSPGGSGSLLASPRSPADSVSSNNNNFSFGRVVFADGQQTDPTLSNIRDKYEGKGPMDPASALKAAEAKKARLAAMDSEKRADIEEKDMWLNAKKRAHGERVRDDTSLLKKALKRKESAKKKSEREWKERVDGVAKGREMRQVKRDENLRKRREEKGGNKGGKKKAGGKPKARPGFEGSFKAKVGGKKK